MYFLRSLSLGKMTEATDANWESQEAVNPSGRGRPKKKTAVATHDAVAVTTSASVAAATSASVVMAASSIPGAVVQEVVSDATWMEECCSLTVPLPGTSVAVPGGSSQDPSKCGVFSNFDEIIWSFCIRF